MVLVSFVMLFPSGFSDSKAAVRKYGKGRAERDMGLDMEVEMREDIKLRVLMGGKWHRGQGQAG